MRWAYVLALLLVVAAYTPVRVYIFNASKFPHPERVLLIIALYFIVGALWLAGLSRLRIGLEAGLASAIALVLLLGSGQGLATSTSTPIALMASVGIAIAIALITNRMSAVAGRALALGVGAFIAAGLTLAWIGGLGGPHTSRVVESGSSVPTELETSPDLFIVVLDGFPGSEAVEEVYGASLDLPDVEGVKREEAWASYPMTIASISSLFEMGYPLGDGDIVDTPTSRELASIMSGDNRFTEILDRHGYFITHVESGYSNSFCDDVVDDCVSSPFLDEGTFGILNESAIAVELREQAGSAFTRGAIHTMDWLRENLKALAENDRADFVFASVLAPHPPLFFDRECNFVYEYWRVGNSVYAGDEIIDERQQAFLDQSQCVAEFEAEILGEMPDRAVTIFLSDHGGDSLGQMSKYDREWSRLDVVERLNVGFSAKTSISCLPDGEILLSEVLRDLLWCLAGSHPGEPHLPERMYTASRMRGDAGHFLLDELSPDEIQQVRAAKG